MSQQATARRKPVGTSVSAERRIARARRHFRIRKKVSGTPERPRLVVTRSSKHISVQVVNDVIGHTLVAASSLEPGVRAMSATKSERATKVGQLVAERAKEAGIDKVVFDRGGYDYHGRVAALADAARAAGLEF